MLYLSFDVVAQKPVFKKFDTNNGLPSSCVFHAIQDKNGYLWFATSIGVSRFNGYEFTNFDTENGLPDNTVFEIYEDYKGRIWFIPFSCKLSYYENGVIKAYPYNDALQKAITMSPNPQKLSFSVSQNDEIMISIRNFGLLRISPQGKTERLDHLSDEKHASYYVDENKKLYIVTRSHMSSGAVRFITPGRDTLVSTGIRNDFFGLYAGCQNRDGNIYFSYGNYLFEYQNKKVQSVAVYDSEIIWLSCDVDNNIWTGTYNNGMYVIPVDRQNKIKPLRILKNASASSVLQDNENGVWITSLDKGLFYYPYFEVKYFDVEDGLLSNQVNKLVTDGENNIWFGYSNRSALGKLAQNEISHDPLSSCANKIMKALHYDNRTGQVVVSSDCKTFILNDSAKAGTIVSPEGNSIAFHTITNRKTNGYFAGGASAFYIVENNIAYKYTKDNDDGYIRVNSICQTDCKKAIFGSIDGLYQFQNGDIQHLSEVNPLFSKDIRTIVKDDKVFWMGTKNAGIIYWGRDTIYNITKSDGLTSNAILSLNKAANTLYAGTNTGLNIITIDTGYPHQFCINHVKTDKGLPSNEIHDIIILKDSIYLATNHGIAFFGKSTFDTHQKNILLTVKSVTINQSDTSLLAGYNVPYYKNSLQIDFESIYYRKQGKIMYASKMEGLDKEWRFSFERIAKYTALPPGDYIFKLKAVSDLKNDISRTIQIPFVIKIPFWHSWWFVTACFVLVILIIIIILRLRFSLLEKQNALRLKINKAVQSSLSQQLNPHFIFNSLNSIQYYIAKNDKELSQLYLVKFANLLRSILQNSKMELISLNEEINILKLYLQLEFLRFKENLKYEIIVEKDINTNALRIPPSLLQPIIENAINHRIFANGSGRHLIICFSQLNNHIVCEIKDNGKNWKENILTSDTEYSLQEITKKRLELFNSLHHTNSSIEFIDQSAIKNENPETIVRLNLPLIKVN